VDRATPVTPPLLRRPIAARDTRWARDAAARLTDANIRPNAISIASIIASGLASVTLVLGSRFDGPAAAILGAAASGFVLLRLLCNLFDGLVAIEGGRGTAIGVLWNELPDRASDTLCLVAAGYAVRAPVLGWIAALLAVSVAYVRALGGSLGLPQSFAGPMAKQHRMAVLAVGALGGAVEALFRLPRRSLWLSLLVVIGGSIVTLARRTARIAEDLG
jgi:phosphatidylglycerophosphate synthase